MLLSLSTFSEQATSVTPAGYARRKIGERKFL